jgi:hypothetical protein
VAIVDLLEIPDDQQIIHNAIWSGLVKSLDSEGLLKSDRFALLPTCPLQN